MIKLIVSDLDGTLLADHEHIHPRNLAAIKRALSMGIRFAVASGRDAIGCSVLLAEHGLHDSPVIGVNGCHVLDKPFGRTLSRHHLPQDGARAAISIFAKYDLPACLYTDNAIIYTDHPMWEAEVAMIDTEERKQYMDSIGIKNEIGQKAIDAALERPVMKTFCIYNHGQEAAFQAARAECERLPGVSVTSSWHNNFEVMPQSVDKGSALALLAESLGIQQSDVLAFGDSENDLPMLIWAGRAFAMKNASSLVMSSIPDHTLRCDEGGVGHAIDQLLMDKHA